MNSAIELHDSVIQSVEVDGSRIRVVFSAAYVHQSSGKPGVDPGQGFIQPAEIVFLDAEFITPQRGDAGVISDASIMVGDQVYSLLPLPFSMQGDLTATFTLVSGVSFCIAANSINCAVHGAPAFVEAFGN